jgi:drug/metabolite transporter (DMT)-like permease
MVNGKLVLSSFASALAATVLVVVAYTFDSLALLYSKPFRAKLPLTQYLFVAQLAAAAVMWIVSFAMYSPTQVLPNQPKIWAAILYVAIVSCVGIFFIWYWLLKYLKGQQLGILQYFHGIAAAALGVVFFGEQLSFQMLLGSLLLFASILVVSLRLKEAHPAPSEA